MNQDFKTTTPYQKAGTDITVSVLGTSIYLSPVIDFLYKRYYIVGTDAKLACLR